MCYTWLAENTGRKKSPSGHHPTTLSGYIFATEARISNRKKNLLSSNISSTCLHNMVNFGLLAAEIVSGVLGTPATFNGFRVLAALLHGSQVVSVSQSLRRWTEGATYVRQGDHHVGHWSTFLVENYICVTFAEICNQVNFLLQNNVLCVKKRQYKKVQSTRKRSCPATVLIKELVYFLDFIVCVTSLLLFYFYNRTCF